MNARVVLADEHVLFTDALQAILRYECTIVEVARDGLQLIDAARRWEPDLVISNTFLPVLTGLDAARVIHSELPYVKTLFVSTQATSISEADIKRSGGYGCLLKTATAADLRAILGQIVAGAYSVSPSPTLGNIASLRPNITPRQIEVLTMVSDGLSTKCIAHALKISCKTVEYHKYNLIKMLGVTNSAGLIRFAIEHGIYDKFETLNIKQPGTLQGQREARVSSRLIDRLHADVARDQARSFTRSGECI